MSVSRITESRVFAAAKDDVWKLVRPVTFSFWKAVESVSVEGSVDAVGSIRKVHFKDGTVQTFRILELSDLENFVTYEVIESNPPAHVLAAYHTLKLTKITHDNSTLVEFTSEFSSEAMTAAVIEDSKYKKKEAFADLAAAL